MGVCLSLLVLVTGFVDKRTVCQKIDVDREFNQVIMEVILSTKAVDLIKMVEGFVPVPYDDETGKPVDSIEKCKGRLTIGYGRTHNVTIGDVTTKEKEIAFVKRKISQIKSGINKLLPKPAMNLLTENQHAALISFVYNVGIDAFRTSTMRKHLNREAIPEACNEFKKWIFVTRNGKKEVDKGLINRRAIEALVFCGVENNKAYQAIYRRK